MKELNLGDKEKLKVKFQGKEYEVNYPDVKTQHDHQKELQKLQNEEADESDKIEFSIKFLENLGLPREVTEALDNSQYERLLNELMGADSKKN